MATNQVKTFLAVIANGSFLEAEKCLHVTQSTVSSRIQGLEEYLGVMTAQRTYILVGKKKRGQGRA